MVAAFGVSMFAKVVKPSKEEEEKLARLVKRL